MLALFRLHTSPIRMLTLAIVWLINVGFFKKNYTLLQKILEIAIEIEA